MRIPVIVAASGVLLAVSGLIVAKVFGTDPVAPHAAATTPAGATPSAINSLNGIVIIKPKGLDDDESRPVYVDGPRPEQIDPDGTLLLETWLPQLLAQTGNLRGWQLCKAEFDAEARATQAYVDAIGKFPHDMPYNIDPASETKDSVGYYTGRAQTMRAAGDLAEKSGVACIDEPTTRTHWLQFQIAPSGKARTVAVPDTYVLDLAHESGEQITLNPKICAPNTHKLWQQLHDQPVAQAVEANSITFSERERYRQMEQLAAVEGLELAMGRSSCTG